MQEQRLYCGWTDRTGAHCYRVVEGKFLKLSARAYGGKAVAPDFDWGDDTLGQQALCLALCQDVVHADHITAGLMHAVSRQFTNMTHRELPWIFTERVIRELCTKQLTKENHCFPLGIWARALDGESATEALLR